MLNDFLSLNYKHNIEPDSASRIADTDTEYLFNVVHVKHGTNISSIELKY